MVLVTLCCSNGGLCTPIAAMPLLTHMALRKKYCGEVSFIILPKYQRPKLSDVHLRRHRVIKKAQAYIESNLNEKIFVEHLPSKFAIGMRHFDGRFIKATSF